MSELNRDIRLEILGVLTNATVKRQELRGSTSIGQTLTIENYLPSVICLPNPPLSIKTPTDNNQQEEESERELFVDLEEFFDPRYDFYFRGREENTECFRGGEPYTRPWGYNRLALKVLDKYPDGNDWLGPDGLRNVSAAGEWPVSFHGTDIEGAKGITGSNYAVGQRNVHGRGIYSTPNIATAESYSMQKTFTSKTNSKKYTVIMQNRINPKERTEIEQVKDYWLTAVPEGSTQKEERKIVESSIRPYGILIKEQKK